MDRARVRGALAVGLVAGLGGVAGSYAVAGYTPAFVVAPVEAGLSRLMPGPVVTVAILELGALGQRLNLALAVGLSTGVLGGLALTALAAARRGGRPTAGPALTAGACWAVTALLTGAPLIALGAAVPPALVVGVVGATRGFDPAVAPGRRRLLAGLATVAGVGGLGYALRRLPLGDDADGGMGGGDHRRAPRDVSDERVRALLAAADAKSLDVEGLEPLVSEQFYEVDVNAVNPTVDAGGWTLSVTGAVERELELDLAGLRERGAREEFVTLRCVGDPPNGHKMDTALWTVVPVAPLLAEVGHPEECCVMLRAADGYYEEFPLAALRGARLAYRMNGAPLPRRHGYPVRALVPGHWGEVNVKWLTGIEVLDEPAEGYWEKRGWHGTGPVNAVAKLHAVDRRDGRVRVAGHAYAGTRGVSAVEVSTDGGATWREATLSEPLPGEDVWRQWTHEYDHPGGRHEAVVRTVDGEGTTQPEERSDPFPRGATGWVSETIE